MPRVLGLDIGIGSCGWGVIDTEEVDPATGEATAGDLIEHTADLGGSSALGNISAFGVDAAGELYLVSYSTGRILRLLKMPLPPRNLRIVRD